MERGAKSLVLTSRTGIRTGYQAFKVRSLRNSGAAIVVSIQTVKDKEDARQLLNTTNKPVGGVFHLAMVSLYGRQLFILAEKSITNGKAVQSLPIHAEIADETCSQKIQNVLKTYNHKKNISTQNNRHVLICITLLAVRMHSQCIYTGLNYINA